MDKPERVTLPSGMRIKYYVGARARLAAGFARATFMGQADEEGETQQIDGSAAAEQWVAAICSAVIDPRIVPNYPAPPGAKWFEELATEDMVELIKLIKDGLADQEEAVRPLSPAAAPGSG